MLLWALLVLHSVLARTAQTVIRIPKLYDAHSLRKIRSPPFVEFSIEYFAETLKISDTQAFQGCRPQHQS